MIEAVIEDKTWKVQVENLLANIRGLTMVKEWQVCHLFVLC